MCRAVVDERYSPLRDLHLIDSFHIKRAAKESNPATQSFGGFAGFPDRDPELLDGQVRPRHSALPCLPPEVRLVDEPIAL